MIESKSRSDILLEERIAQIDDINFDKIYDVQEFAEKQIEDFDEQNFAQDINFDDITLSSSQIEPDAVFEMELQPNEFLDNLVWQKEEEQPVQSKKSKFSFSNKPLFFAFTSIAFLLGILLIYNVFVINSLTKNLNKPSSLSVATSKTVYQQQEDVKKDVSNNIVFEQNDYLY
ncbi:MAG: hypothetical protein IJD48_02375 [Clostridia bacterium]|nr:hypothetical protein [Clostridia bacterium]